MERRLFLKDLSLFQTLFKFFNVNEYLAVSFVELAKGGSREGHLRFFCLHKITFTHYDIERLRGGNLEARITGGN